MPLGCVVIETIIENPGCDKEPRMKKALFCIVISLCAGISLFAQDKAEGLWKSIDEKTGEITAAWRIYQKEGVLFGEILVVPGKDPGALAVDCKSSYEGFPLPGDVRKMKLTGTPFIYGLKPKSSGQWEGGRIIDPKDGKNYQCKITFRAADGKKYKVDTLEMRGEIGLGIGRSQFWERTTEAEIEVLRAKPRKA